MPDKIEHLQMICHRYNTNFSFHATRHENEAGVWYTIDSTKAVNESFAGDFHATARRVERFHPQRNQRDTGQIVRSGFSPSYSTWMSVFEHHLWIYEQGRVSHD